MVVGVNWFFGSKLSSCDFNTAVGDNLVSVHVRLRAASGLPHAEREMVVEFTVNHFVSGLDDKVFDVAG